MGDQEEVIAIDQVQETANGTEEIEKKTGGRKWFTRSASAGKQKSAESGTMKPRSRSVFAFLCNLVKKKDKKKPKSETVDGLDKADVETDQDETRAEATPTTNQPFPYTEYPPAALGDGEEEGVSGPSKAEAEFNQCMDDMQDWLDFGNSLGMRDQEMIKILEQADVVPSASTVSTKIQMVKTDLKPVIEEDDSEIEALVAKAPSFALGSVGRDHEWPSIMPLGVPGNTSKCSPLAFMTVAGSKKEPKAAGLDSAASVKDAKALTSYESEQTSELLVSLTANATEKGCPISKSCSVSSFYSTIAPDSITISTTVPVQNIIDVTPEDPSNTVLISDGGEESVTMNEECVQELASGASKQCCSKLKSAIEGESKTAILEESK